MIRQPSLRIRFFRRNPLGFQTIIPAANDTSTMTNSEPRRNDLKLTTGLS
jgi:hypothetical protein